MVFSEITGFGNYCSLRPETLQMQTIMKSIKVCEYSRSRSFHYDLILQDQASGERSQDQWSSGFLIISHCIVCVLARLSQKQSNRRPCVHACVHKDKIR